MVERKEVVLGAEMKVCTAGRDGIGSERRGAGKGVGDRMVGKAGSMETDRSSLQAIDTIQYIS